MLLERPRRGVAVPVASPLPAPVDEDEPVAPAERVEVVAEHRVVEPRTAVQDQQRQPGRIAALDDVQPGVADADQRMPISELSPTMKR